MAPISRDSLSLVLVPIQYLECGYKLMSLHFLLVVLIVAVVECSVLFISLFFLRV